jgi:hypothetical protein
MSKGFNFDKWLVLIEYADGSEKQTIKAEMRDWLVENDVSCTIHVHTEAVIMGVTEPETSNDDEMVYQLTLLDEIRAVIEIFDDAQALLFKLTSGGA